MELIERIGFPEQVGERIKRRGFSSRSMADSIQYIGQQIEWGGLESNQLLREYWYGVQSIEDWDSDSR